MQSGTLNIQLNVVKSQLAGMAAASGLDWVGRMRLLHCTGRSKEVLRSKASGGKTRHQLTSFSAGAAYCIMPVRQRPSIRLSASARLTAVLLQDCMSVSSQLSFQLAYTVRPVLVPL